MQTLEEGPVALAGPGYVDRPSKSFGPGEYQDLKNVIITPQGTLKKRSPAQGLSYSHTGLVPGKAIGAWGSDAVFTSYSIASNNTTFFRRSEFTQSLQNITVTNWAALKTALDTASAFPGGHTHTYLVEGIFQYNNSNYFIVIHGAHLTSGSDTTYRSKYYIVKGNYNYLHPERNYDITFDTAGLVSFLSLTDLVSPSSGSNHSSSIFPVTSFTIHKERLLIAIRDTVYMSKATDPTKFSVVDDGAFIKFPFQYVKKIIALGDAIYAVFDNSISYITYNQGPNSDMQVRSISEAVGGEDACLYGDTLYLLKSDSIYSINGTNLSKVLDFELSLYEGPRIKKVSKDLLVDAIFPSYKIVAFDDALYVISRNHTFVVNNGHILNTLFKGVSTSMFRIDLNNGHISRFTYVPFGAPFDEEVIKDIYVINAESIQTDQSSFYVLGSSSDNIKTCVLTHSSINYFYYTDSARYNDVLEHGYDVFSNSIGTNFNVHPIPINIHISGFSPDGLKYYKKKFRSILIQANMPVWSPISPVGTANGGWEAELELNVLLGANLDDGLVHSAFSPYTPPKVTYLIKDPLYIAPNNSVLGYRFGALQRAKAIDIQIKTRDSVIAAGGKSRDNMTPVDEGKNQLILSLMEIVDITTLWTPIRRGPTGSYLTTDQS